MNTLSEKITRKFTEVIDVNDWLIETDTGWESIIDVKETEPYQLWKIILNNGYFLICADDHIVFRDDYSEVFVKDLVVNDLIQTDQGINTITEIIQYDYSEPMYDIGVDSLNHRFYTNGILSHNTTCAAAYLLWYAMFHPDKTVLIAAHKFVGAQEIMMRIRYGYELCPDHIRCGVVNYNKGSMEFDNGSRIVSTTTTDNTGRGMSVSLLYLDEYSFVQPNIATSFWSSISPTLSTGGRAIITSTPNSDEDMFATIWKESQDLTDEFGNIKTDGTGRNGFYGFRAYWWEHPDRDETWKQRELNKIGEELFRREFECVSYDTIITLKDQNDIFDIEIGQLFDTNLVNDQILYKDKMLTINNKNYQVLTPNGFQPFEGVAYMGDEQILELRFDNGKSLRCTLNHKIYINLEQFLYAYQLELGDKILTLNGYNEITAIVDINEIIPVYDLIEVANGHRYWTNNILSSNCEFLVYDETLVNSIKLAELSGREPMLKTGQVRWYKKPSPGHVYLVALDPSMGTGSNNAAIEIFELPNFVQVGEWYHNITPVQSQVKILRDILRYIQNEIGAYNSNNIYWSCENNTVGEAALIVINDLGEDTFPGYFLSEPIKKGHVKKFRKGFNTTFGNKISACSRLKFLVEQDKMTINSYSLISELKSYIAAGTSFRAKQGTMDDLVSATLLVVRMSVVLADWDPKIFEALSVGDSFDNDWDEPMPIFISTNYG